LDKDAYSLRRFVDGGVKVALAQSFAKNFGLYGQRIGCFSVMTDNKTESDAVSSQIKFIARAQYSNPPKHGAHIVDIVLSNPDLTQEWHRELKVMSGRISSIRRALYDNLQTLGSKQNWDHIINQIGMFAFTGLNLDQCKQLKSNYHVYLTDDGRISISGLNTKNVAHVAKAFHEVTNKI
jgi:aspartate/tyrosine/aromatic aminotransferase